MSASSWPGWRARCPATSSRNACSSGMSCPSPGTARSPRRSCARNWRRAGACRSTSRARPRPSPARTGGVHLVRHGCGPSRSQITLAADAAPSLTADPMGNDMQESRTAFVTGGGSGIGLAIVRGLLDEGWRVVAADLVQDRLDQARQHLAGENERIHFEQLDVTDEESVKRAIARSDAEFAPLTALVNSAGIAADVPCLETSTGLFRKILEVNVMGSFVASREAALHMREHGHGSIVNIASVSGIRGNTGRVAYGSSKGGAIMMTKVMASELG